MSSPFTRGYPLHAVNIIAKDAGRRWSDQSKVRAKRYARDFLIRDSGMRVIFFVTTRLVIMTPMG